MIRKRVYSQMLLWLMIVLLAAPPGALAQTVGPPPPPPPAPAPPQPGQPSDRMKQEELDQLLAPIALYPDALLAQILMASTYPLEVVQAARWQKANPNIKDTQLEDALQQQPWDPSVKSLTAFPEVLQMMNEKLDWTQKLGDAFLGQEQQVMNTVQQLRAKAQSAGNLMSTPEQKVIVEQAAPQQTIIRIEPASPQVVYVPTYDPTVVYGAWPYPAYPPYYYYPPGYVVGAGLFWFGAGFVVGAALWGGCNWHSSSVNININNFNNFNRTHISNGNWQHNVNHRGAVPYRDASTRQQFGRGQQPGAGTREAYRGRAEQGRQQLGQGGFGQQPETRPGGGRTGAGQGGPGQRVEARPSGPGQRPEGRPSGAGQRPEARPAPRPSLEQRGGASTFDGVGRGGDAKQWSSRGQTSRQTMSAPKAPSGGGGVVSGAGRTSAGGSSGASRTGGGTSSGGGRSGGGGGRK